ncbi:MAG: LLM class flavin-dependent oxidoreductase [Cyclobacteriaceae bacterium]
MIDFSLFFFSNYEVDQYNKYHLLLEAVKYIDQNEFKAVWTPERHFHEFGGLFPNPSVTSAALAMITENIELRSGSLVSPLHDVVRIAEEWSVVDNLSNGRVSLSFASGWNGNDFVLSPENYQDRHQVMIDQIETVKNLWKGGSITRKNGVGKSFSFQVYPSPIQKELPIWITAAGNPKTYSMAGEMGANLLTHLLGQDIEEATGKIALYREAREKNGFDPDTGKVAMMLHTYVGETMEQAMEVVEEPFIEYLKSATNLSKFLYEEAGYKADEIPEEDKEAMLKHSFQRYSKEAALIGTVTSCSEMVNKMFEIGVNEIACLVDFGIKPTEMLKGLEKLNELKSLY